MSEKKETCYSLHERTQSPCQNKACRYNVESVSCQNCVLISAKKRSTLQEIGDIYGVTRMRICQIEKKAIGKLGSVAKYLRA